jgi:hypothetical protein
VLLCESWCTFATAFTRTSSPISRRSLRRRHFLQSRLIEDWYLWLDSERVWGMQSTRSTLAAMVEGPHYCQKIVIWRKYWLRRKTASILEHATGRVPRLFAGGLDVIPLKLRHSKMLGGGSTASPWTCARGERSSDTLSRLLVRRK